MYEYKFASTSLGGLFTSPKHREAIAKHAAEGWRLVQVLPLKYDGHGIPLEHELIFEGYFLKLCCFCTIILGVQPILVAN
ncbi:DUF4177 domain-containing protein [Bacillus sp. BGMRC 2118]|nr:DUF4177 domain-containing protein [Bacillus sp. BGMRC 2118]